MKKSDKLLNLNDNFITDSKTVENRQLSRQLSNFKKSALNAPIQTTREMADINEQLET